jgi:hypothetical protein
MAHTENINVKTTKEVIDAAVQAAEAIPVKPNNKFGVIGGVVFVGGLVITGIALGIRHHKNKKAKEAKEAAGTGVDSAQAEKDDFEEYDSAEE